MFLIYPYYFNNMTSANILNENDLITLDLDKVENYIYTKLSINNRYVTFYKVEKVSEQEDNVTFKIIKKIELEDLHIYVDNVYSAIDIAKTYPKLRDNVISFLNNTSTILEWLTLFPEDYNKLYKKYIDLSTDFCLLRLATKFPNERNILISYVSTCYTAIEWIYRFPEDKLKILNTIKEKSNMDYYSTVTHFDKFPY